VNGAYDSGGGLANQAHIARSAHGIHPNLCITAPNGGYADLCATNINGPSNSSGSFSNLCATKIPGPFDSVAMGQDAPNGGYADLCATNINGAYNSSGSFTCQDHTRQAHFNLCATKIPGPLDSVVMGQGQISPASDAGYSNLCATKVPCVAFDSKVSFHSASLPTSAQQTVASRSDAELRNAWAVGSILDVFSASGQRWHVATIVQVARGNGPDVLTVQFHRGGEPQMKQIFRSDAYLDVVGARTTGEVPPGFQTIASRSRPGQLVYLDTTTSKKYSTVELAWQLHFERLLQSHGPPLDDTLDCIHGGAHGARRQLPHNAPMTAYGPAPTAVACN